MEEIKISVIVPMYNAENYIYKCLESLLKQTYKNFEILLIDDGSIDNTKKICMKYIRSKRPSIKYFHKSNGGTSSARNFGIVRSKSEYITFLYQDDYIDLNHIKNFFENLKNYDWIMQGLINVTEKNKVIKIHQVNHRIDCREKNSIDKYVNSLSAFDWVNNKLYKKSIVLKNNIAFYTPQIINEDRVFNINYSMFVERFLMLPGYSYYWVENFNSQTHKYIHPIIFYREACVYDNLIDKNKKWKNLSKYCCKHAVRCFIHCLGLCIMSQKYRITKKERAKLIKCTAHRLFFSKSLNKYPVYTVKLILLYIYDYIKKFFQYRKQKNFDLL